MTTATFSCIKQSTALGCFPRLKIIHTSRKFMGQIYIPVINWFLLALSLVLVCTISSIDEIGNAYGNEHINLFLFLHKTYQPCLRKIVKLKLGDNVNITFLLYTITIKQFASVACITVIIWKGIKLLS